MKTFKEFLYNTHGSHAKEGILYNTHGSHAKDKSVHENLKSALANIDTSNDQYHKEHGSFEKEFLNKSDNKHLGSNTQGITDRLHKLQPVHNTNGEINAYTNYSGDLTRALKSHHKAGTKPSRVVGGVNIDHLDSNITPAKQEIHTYSGSIFAPNDIRPVGKSKSGNFVYKQPTYMSATHDKMIASQFADDGRQAGSKVGHIWHFHNRKGDPVIFAGRHSEFDHEHETIQPRTDSTNEQYHLEHYGTSTYHDKDGNRYDVHHIRRIPASEVIFNKGK